MEWVNAVEKVALDMKSAGLHEELKNTVGTPSSQTICLCGARGEVAGSDIKSESTAVMIMEKESSCKVMTGEPDAAWRTNQKCTRRWCAGQTDITLAVDELDDALDTRDLRDMRELSETLYELFAPRKLMRNL